MAIYLHDKFAPKVAEVFVRESFADGRLNDQYSFSGAKTVKISTIVTVPLNDYNRQGLNRYGSPEEIQDTVQELTMSQDKSFTMTIDKGNNLDQNGTKGAAKVLALEIKERVVPEKDKYTFSRLASMAGSIVGNATPLSKSNICERISEGTHVLDDAEVPESGRTLFVTPAVYKLLRLSDEFIKNEALGRKALAKGQVGEYDNMPVVKVISSRFPKNVNFMIVHKSAATAPSKIADTKIHTDPPGLSGNLLEGRFYYDCFVIGAKANGIYVEVDTSSGNGSVLTAPSLTAAGAVTVPSGSTVKYTLDGSDPRYSASSIQITASTSGLGQAGDVLKAYAFLPDGSAFPSPVAQVTRS